MVTTKGLLKRLREFENSGDGYGYDLRLDLADIILRRLDEKGWTQKELAQKAGIKESFLSRIIHAESNCTFEVVGRLLFALGVKPKLTQVDVASESSLRWSMFDTSEKWKGQLYGTEESNPFQTVKGSGSRPSTSLSIRSSRAAC